MASASASSNGNFFTRHGRYLLVVTECQGKVGANKGFKGESISVRLRVVEANRTGLTKENGTHGVGDTLSTVYNFTKHPESAPGRLKSLVLALFGRKETEITKDQMEVVGDRMIGPQQPFVGKLVRCETTAFTSKNVADGVGQTWEHVPQTAESMAEERAKILGADVAAPAAEASAG
jgi:hypothetical protein